MGFSGRLEGIAPSDIFQIISQNRMTGTLIARCPDRTAMVVFKNGQVMEATSDAAQESLGHLLVSQGLMNEETIQAARERLKQEPDRSLGAILVLMGAISEETLKSVVFRQIGHIVHRLMSCDDGFLTFDRGETAVKRKLNTREFFLPSGISTEFLLMERARTMDEDRRSGIDRRGHGGNTQSAEWPAAQERRSAVATTAAVSLSRVQNNMSWLRTVQQRTTTALRTGVDASIRTGKELFAKATGLYRATVLPRFATARDKVRAFSPDGKALIIAGAASAAAGIALILLTAFSYQSKGSDLLITGRIVKIRATPTTKAKVIAKVEKGDTVAPLAFEDGWHKVRTRAGETGWIWKNLVAEQEKKPAFRYRPKGFELIFIAGIALLVAGVMRRRKASTSSLPAQQATE